MDANEIAIREMLADKLDAVWKPLNELLELWFSADLDPNFLRPDEYPFTESLEDLTAHVNDAAEKIRERNAWHRMRPVTMYVSQEDFEAILAELDKPARELPKLKALLENARPDEWQEKS